MLVVLALGGNALLRRGEPLEFDVQRQNLQAAVIGGLAPIARKHQVVITHGNGPQIGLLALQAAAYRDVSPYPLDVLGAESEGMIGYLVAQAMTNAVPGLDIATLLTQVEVDPDDPAFRSGLSCKVGTASGAQCHRPHRVGLSKAMPLSYWFALERRWSALGVGASRSSPMPVVYTASKP
jgi:carbamate kinase